MKLYLIDIKFDVNLILINDHVFSVNMDHQLTVINLNLNNKDMSQIDLRTSLYLANNTICMQLQMIDGTIYDIPISTKSMGYSMLNNFMNYRPGNYSYELKDNKLLLKIKCKEFNRSLDVEFRKTNVNQCIIL